MPIYTDQVGFGDTFGSQWIPKSSLGRPFRSKNVPKRSGLKSPDQDLGAKMSRKVTGTPKTDFDPPKGLPKGYPDFEPPPGVPKGYLAYQKEPQS